MVDFIPPTLNGFRAIRVELHLTWLGAWVANVELDLDVPEAQGAILSSETPAILIVGGTTLIGTIDPSGSSTFAGKASARVVGGRGGWSKIVEAPAPFHNPAGILPSQLVYTAIGALVGEIVADPIPQNFGKNFVFQKGPASSVFGDRNWFVEPTTGVTIVGPWPSLPNLLAAVLDWSPTEQRATLTSDNLVLPGTILADPRFGTSTYTVRDVTMTFTRETGSIAHAWCSDDAGSRLTGALKSAIQTFGGLKYYGFYKYRYILPMGGELALQAVTAGAPDIVLGDILAALPSSTPLFTPGVEVIVGFLGGDPSQPFLASPTELIMALQTFLLQPPLTALTVTANAVALAAKLLTLANNGMLP